MTYRINVPYNMGRMIQWAAQVVLLYYQHEEEVYLVRNSDKSTSLYLMYKQVQNSAAAVITAIEADAHVSDEDLDTLETALITVMNGVREGTAVKYRLLSIANAIVTCKNINSNILGDPADVMKLIPH